MTAEDYRLLSNEERAALGPPECMECDTALQPYGLFSPDTAPRFDHPNASPALDPLDDCSLARRSRRLGWFGRDAKDEVRGAAFRREFYLDDHVLSAYALCHSFCGRGNLSLAKFARMLERADRLQLWSYVGLRHWCVPHVLLLLEDFGPPERGGFHFALIRAGSLSAIWMRGPPVSIVKLHSACLQPFHGILGGPNPRRILPTDVDRIDASWMSANVVKALRDLRVRAGA